MLSVHLPPGLRQVANRHADLFAQKFSWNDFMYLFSLHLFGLNGLSDLARTFPQSPSVSALSLAVKHFPSNRFQKRLMTGLLKRFGEKLKSGEAILAIDETSNVKYGLSIVGHGRWRKSSHKSYEGQKIVVLAIIDRVSGQAFPINYRICEKGENNKQSIPTYKLSLSLLDEVEELGYPKCTLAMDSWFDSADFMEKLTSRGWDFVIELKSNRLVKCSPLKNISYHKIKKSFRGLPKTGVKYRAPRAQRTGKTKYVTSKRLFIKRYNKQLQVVAVSNTLKHKPFGFYATNKLNIRASEIWMISRSRWHIEEAFKNLKTYFSFGRLACHGSAGTEVSLSFSFLILAELQAQDLSKWGLPKLSSDSVGTIALKIRQQCFHKCLHLMLHNPNHHSIERIKQRTSLNRINKKPVNSTAGKGYQKIA